jgi:hypothetical protein
VPLTARSFEALTVALNNGGIEQFTVRPVAVALDEFVQPGDPLDISAWDDEKFAPVRGAKMDSEPGLGNGLEDTGVLIEIRSPVVAALVKPDMRNEERFQVIMHLYEQGYSLGEVMRFLRENLSPEKFKHAVYYERQPQRVYQRYAR